jgi:hypothetical protein
LRIIGFCKKWDKLQQDKFTTFRYPRADSDKGRDWHEGETVKIVYHPRQEHEVLGVARIVEKEPRQCQTITDEAAVADGFQCINEMMKFLDPCVGYQVVNKLTLEWVERVEATK